MKNTRVYFGAAGRLLPTDEQRDTKQRELADKLTSIARFKEQQLLRRDWIAVDDVIDWRSRDRETGVERQDYRISALRDFDLAIRTGAHFFIGEQSRILLTFPFVDVPAALSKDPFSLPASYWLSRAEWQAQHELAPAQHDESDEAKLKRLFKSHLQWAWIPRELCLRWSENVPFKPRPEWFKNGTPVAQDDDSGAEKTLVSKRRTNNARGRPKDYPWDTIIKEYALSLVKKHGVPGEGNNKLPRREDLVKAIQNEWAQTRDIHLATSSVRRYVRKWLSEL
ncbi:MULTISPECIES: hypothetical protein [Bradyrhizobium]|uniref:hypothetical protein n=1 Tax=Bradyrhizobium TaxID=374 RepID=UPI000231BD19|nr:hypothetical protein [Bradyrhizobium japonicum]MCS3535541.1 hypothetical protein [Bradyrhizobium japonicum]MCS3988358.1 hypothetical protein [Bradyrhizobium japonicum]MCS4016824.1 hypothetical protein [Bradyrhizobium japonicum]MCS4203919.1 hypothetical protein [Bradyrhizobium japonicum]MDH6174363.1 hypothetical protein [Bradyrhizobium japonicum]